ncbi:MAG: SRPBCC family protein [Phycisphaerales bacterium]
MADEAFQVDPDITAAQTLPGRAYTDPAVYDLCRQRVFRRSWQVVADREAVKVPGQCHPVTLLPGCLDEPILLTRDREDRLHGLSNVCTHRGTILCEHGGVEKSLVCRYHGRRFDLDGTFRHMPEFEGVKGFPSPSDNLPKVAMGSWGDQFLFASLDPAAPLADILRPLAERLAWLPLRDLRFDASRSRDYLVRANWALYIDNYLEGFHIPFVHASLNEAIDYGAYSTELFPWSNLQLGIAKPGEPAFDLPPSSPDHGKRIAAYYWWLFPSTMFNIYPWGVSVNVVEPQAVDRTRVRFLSYILDERRLDQGAGSGLDRVEREDEAVVEAVQRGTRSSLYGRGRYSPTREQGVHHFHCLLAAALFPADPGAGPGRA